MTRLQGRSAESRSGLYVEGGAGAATAKGNDATLVPVILGAGYSFALNRSASWRFDLGLQGLELFRAGAVPNRPGERFFQGGYVGPHLGITGSLGKGFSIGASVDGGPGNANYVDAGNTPHRTSGVWLGGGLELTYHSDW